MVYDIISYNLLRIVELIDLKIVPNCSEGHTPVIPALRRLKQKDHKFEA